MPPPAGPPRRPRPAARWSGILAAVAALIVAVGAVVGAALTVPGGGHGPLVASVGVRGAYGALVGSARPAAGAAGAPAVSSPPAAAGRAASSNAATDGASSSSTAASTRASAAADPLVAAGLPSAKAWTRAVRRTRSWVRAQGARIRFAILVDGHTWSFRGSETTHSNSLIKASVLVAYLRRSSVRDRALTAREKALITPMIRESANDPVSPLISMMGGLEPLRRLGRLVGMRSFQPVIGLWGASRISAVDEARLFSRLYSILPPRHRAYALGLLASIIPAQRWGMPKAAPRGWKVAFKSGWNGTGRVVQALRLTCRGHVVSVSVLVDGSSQGGSEQAVERTGRRLLQPLRRRGAKACSSIATTG